jgi:cell fate (sporulation/competence/biofilm development) regulator YlbF (YheA/YmcA/DUF963 family)
MNGDMIKEFYVFNNAEYKNQVVEDNEKVFAYLDQFNKLKIKYK